MVKYYYAGATRVAMQTGSGTINFLLGDHLGSTAITTTNTGTKSAEIRYYPWGTTRYTSGTTPTTYKFTGQRYECSIGLYYYGARWYDSSAGRFISADNIIPGAGNPQAYDRYAYALNNPLRYTDPNGHEYCESRWADPSECAEAGAVNGHIPVNETNEPLMDDSTYDGETITKWGGNPPGWSNDAWRIERARLVWGWLCVLPGGCPNLIELTAWLLFQEGSIITGDDRAFDIMARAIRYRLRNGITDEALSGFTAFINPNGGGLFDEGDWNELLSAPSAKFTDKMEDIYSLTGSYVTGGESNPVIYWWLDSETIGGDVGTHSTKVVADFGPPIQYDQMYFGNYSQCHASGFVACP